MVFARSKLAMEDNCFEEQPGSITLRYVGPNVPKLYKKAYDLMKSVFRVTDSDIQETDYSWGKTSTGEKFKVEWWLHKDMDLFSYLYIRFRLDGEGNEKTGHAKLEVRGLLRSEYPQDTVWQRSLFYEMIRTFWHRIFYHKKREEYAEECRHSEMMFMAQLREFLKELRGELHTDMPDDGRKELKKIEGKDSMKGPSDKK
ncbi:MAG: hypothetical protein DRO99_04655 [Candidatus Aenigmatarchaeota archaeon]|nr:MAG: hypothetical protein DRO99_04655 [Candidatus Aenigmarchaeota archaeon]